MEETITRKKKSASAHLVNPSTQKRSAFHAFCLNILMFKNYNAKLALNIKYMI